MGACKRSSARKVDVEKSFEEATKKMNRGKYAKKSSGKTVGIIALLGGIGVLLLTGLFVFLLLAGYIGNLKLADDVVIAGVKVGGMNRKDAIAAVSQAVEKTYSSRSVEVVVGNNLVILNPNVSEAELDVSKAVTMAFLKRAKGNFDVTPYVSINEEAVRSALVTLKEPYLKSTFTESSYKITGTRPLLDEEHLEDPVQQLEIYTGTPSYQFSEDDLYATVLAAFGNNVDRAVYEVPTRKPAAIDLAGIHNENYVAPVSAEMDKTTFEVSQHAYGYGLDMESAEKLLAQTPYGQTVTIPFVRINPATTHEDLSSLLFRDVLSSFTSVASSQWGRDDNLRLACASINGIVLLPGEVFDYNQALGERTAAKGYKPAAAYMGAETVQSIGGGICQPSSTLYYCALVADLEIVTRVNHGYLSSYVPYGMDATVSWGGPDFRFRNNTEYPIRIEAYSYGGSVTVKLHGTDTKDYYVKMTYEVVSVDNWKLVEKE